MQNHACVAPPNLTREEKLLVMARSGVAERTLRHWQQGRAKPASAKRIEDALTAIRAERATPATAEVR
jgi:hypothetical protein